MATQIIQTLIDGTALYTQVTALDGVSYRLTFSFNPSDQHWYLTVRTEADAQIQGCEGMKLVQGGFPLRKSTDQNRPPGELVVFSELETEPGLNDLGDTTLLGYIPEADLEELLG